MAFFQTESSWVQELGDGVAMLVLDVPGESRNPLSLAVLHDLGRCLDAIADAARFRLVILKSGKTHFSGGVGAEGWSEVARSGKAGELSQAGQTLCERIQTFPLPTVALVVGICQAGGLELAMACDYRVLVDQHDTVLGLSDLELGLAPIWGGTVRLPRLVGLERSLKMLLGSKKLRARDALAWGLADGLVENASDPPPDFLDQPKKRNWSKLPYPTWRQWLVESHGFGRRRLLHGAEVLLRKKLPDAFPSPWEILATVRTGIENGPAAGMEQEREVIQSLIESAAFKNLTHLAQERDRLRHPPRATEGKKKIKQVAFVGPGAVGSAIAHLAVSRGCHIVLKEMDETSLGYTLMRMIALQKHSLVQGQLSEEESQSNLSRIHGTSAWKGFDDLELVIESTGGSASLLASIETHVDSATLIATTAGALQTEGLKHPGRVAGLRFFPPAISSPLVEVMQGPRTADSTAQMLMSWCQSLGKPAFLVRGLCVARVWHACFREAVALLREGLSMEQIDLGMRRHGLPIGPFMFIDQLSLDWVADNEDRLSEIAPIGASRESLFRSMVERGWLGNAIDRGFYDHGRRSRPNTAVYELLRGVAAKSLSKEDQQKLTRERIVAAVNSEAQKVIQEGIIADAKSLDVAMALTGWAPHRGGILASES